MKYHLWRNACQVRNITLCESNKYGKWLYPLLCVDHIVVRRTRLA